MPEPTLKVGSTLDSRGFLCPMPVVKTKLALEDMEPGQVLRVLATDKGAQRDFPVFCRETGHKLLRAEEKNGLYTFYIEKA